MSTPIPTNPNPFVDPNNALRQFNQYFGDLRKQYGEDAIRQVGFEPKEFQDLQSSLRKLQLDPRATPEQHREAYMQARDTLARRLTTPLEATRSYSMVSQPKPAPSPSVGSDDMVTPMQSPNMKSPTQEQLYSYARAVGRGETGQWDPVAGAFLMTGQPIQPQGGLTMAEQPEIGVTAPQGVGYGAGVGPSSPMPVTKSPFVDEKGNTHFPDGSVMADGPSTRPPWAIPPLPPSVKGPAPFRAPPTDMREVIGFRHPHPGVRGGDTRIFADQPMAYPGGDPNFNESTGVYTPEPKLSTLLGQGLSKVGEMFRNAETMPKTRPGILGGMQPRALTPEEAMGITSAQQPEIAVKPQYDMPVMPMRPSTGMGLGSALGMPMQPQSIANAMQQSQGLTLSNVPQSARLTLSNVPQQPAAAPQGMALGGLMRKYGGMC